MVSKRVRVEKLFNYKEESLKKEDDKRELQNNNNGFSQERMLCLKKFLNTLVLGLAIS